MVRVFEGMKGTLDRTKVILRHLPPSITESMLLEQVDSAFSGRYNWLSFRPGKSSQKNLSYSRAYVDFKRPEDVLEFAEFFNGHVFVSEKGAQFKAVVEYAPSQRVPKQFSNKDGREGTISKDPEYLEFLEFLAKPVENLPSAEIQLERREAERAGVSKDSPIVTPLMDFVRQKRAAKGASRRSLSNGKVSKRAGGLSGGSPSSASSRRGSEKRRGSTTVYVLRDSLKNASGKDKSAYILVSKRDDKQLSDKHATLATPVGTQISEEESGVSGITDAGKKKVLLLKGKEREFSHVAGSMLRQQDIASPITKILGSTPIKQNVGREGRIIRGVLLNKDARESSRVQSEQQLQAPNLEKDRRPSRHSHAQLVLKDTNSSDDKVGSDLHGSEKPERRRRNKDRPDRGVWTLRRSDGSYASDESLSSSASQSAQMPLDSSEGAYGDTKVDLSNVRSMQPKTVRSGRNSSFDGSSKHGSRCGAVADGSSVVSDGKPGKRGNASAYGSHEKQVWVQKSSSGS
ncbi:regulator of nonsense transcripts UPF3 isoform X2 [Gossypium raimondii]|uniref:UPF3 domain-containing protein n=3 Tax=Gossypium raimondii TaxID=29730 RepID=A0A0D2PNQ4_GOSRA|nr:regulator of nonsense transcripts UPF3 isoform X2 [Gossypium raimondii]KJB47860.1 hypothetical protein B456_008G045900 [Gossypium raimondii]KJB47862.1 hypothetical protein B456_008G045900 [Gossypium raimondii]KJB47865.1 hypothetical protein B456_008G045900 [Gossypium raimondii]